MFTHMPSYYIVLNFKMKISLYIICLQMKAKEREDARKEVNYMSTLTYIQ